ncbi:MAG: cadherin domain-containing protein, partial [Hyphococcus sp.]
VATLSAVDPDEGDTAAFSLADDPSGLFEVVGNELKLKDGVSLDHEAQDVYEVGIAVEDGAGNRYIETVTVNVADINEAPVDITLSGDTIDENDAGATVATLSVADPDLGDSAAFYLADDPSGLFEVVDGALKLKDGVALDHEAQDAYEVVLAVVDCVGNRYTERVTINVADVNETPADIVLSADSVDENSDGATVATLSAVDPDAGDTAVFSLSDDPSGLFEVVGNELKLKDGVSLDHEAQDAYEVTLAVEDSAGNVYTETVTVNVADINETPVDIALSGDTVDENHAGATVATLSASDPDAGDTATFSLADDPSGLFEVIGNELKLKDGASLDHEAQDAYELTLSVEDSAGNVYAETVTVNVADVNEAPVDFMLTPGATDAALSLNQMGDSDDLAIASNVEGFPTEALTVEVTFASSQTDVGNGTPLFSYAADGGSHNEALIWLEGSSGRMAIFLAGRKVTTDIPNASLLDGEQHTVSFTWDQSSDELTVYVDGEEAFSRSVSVRDLRADGTITLGQEQDSEGGRFDANQVFEGEISEVRIFDHARSADEIRDNAGSPFANPESEPGLVTNWVMNESDGGVVRDLAGGNDLFLQNGAEITSGETFIEPTVFENDAGATVGVLSAIDPDTGGAVSDFSIADDPSGFFEVVGNELKLKDGVSLDHEAQNSFEIVLQATDDTGLAVQQTFVVNVADVNEAPTDIVFDASAVVENDAGATVATLSAIDPDAGDSAVFAIADDRSGLFEVVGNELKLKDGAALDFEAQPEHVLTLEARDGDGAVYRETVTVNVADANDAPTDIVVSGGGDSAFQEEGGLLVIEAEHFDSQSAGDGHAWGASDSDGAMHVDDGAVFNNMWRDKADVETNAPELTYQVEFKTPGTYYVHIRGATEDGPVGNADSVHIGLDGERLTGDGGVTGFGGDLSWGGRDTYTGQVVTIVVDEPGVRTLNLWAREDGVSVDKIVLTQDENYRPNGEGPPESPRPV